MSRTLLLLILLAMLVVMVTDTQSNKKKNKNKNNGGGKKKNKHGGEGGRGRGGGNSNKPKLSEPAEETPRNIVIVEEEEEDELELIFDQEESISNYDIYFTLNLELGLDLLYLSGSKTESYIKGSVVLSYEKVDMEEDEEPMILDSMGPMVISTQARYFDSAQELKVNLKDYDMGTPFRDIDFLELKSGSGIAVDVNPARLYGQVRISYKLTQESFDDLTLEVLRMGKDEQGNGVFMLHNKPGYARTWIPCQDSPFVKPKVRMNLAAPPGYTAFGTGSRLHRRSEANVSSFSYFFPISLQSLSLFVGKVELAEQSERTSVWLTPSNQDDDSYVKLSGLRRIPDLLAVCERMAGPLVDEHVNVVVLPSTISVAVFQHPGPSVIYVPNELVNTEHNINDRDTFVVLEMASQLFKNWFKVLLTPADEKMSHLLDGISEYLALRATSEIMGDNDQLFRLLSASHHHKPTIPLFGPIYGINYMKQLELRTPDPTSIYKALRLFILYHAYETVEVEDFRELVELVFVNNREGIEELDEYLHNCYREVCSELVVDESGEEGPDYRQVRQVDDMMREWAELEDPEIKIGKIKKLSYEQIVYMTSRVSYTEGLTQKTLKKLTVVLQKTGHYDDSFIRPRWIANVMSLGYGYSPLLQDSLSISLHRGPSDLISRSLLYLVQQYAESKGDRALQKQVRRFQEAQEEREGFLIAGLFVDVEM